MMAFFRHPTLTSWLSFSPLFYHALAPMQRLSYRSLLLCLSVGEHCSCEKGFEILVAPGTALLSSQPRANDPGIRQ